MDEAIEIALTTGCRIYGSQEGVSKKDILEFVKKVGKWFVSTFPEVFRCLEFLYVIYVDCTNFTTMLMVNTTELIILAKLQQ